MSRKTREAVALDFEATLESLRAYRKSDPDFEHAIADYIDAEASLKEDPAEGEKWTSPPERSDFQPDSPKELLSPSRVRKA
jgi:hypothetical protein